MKLNWGLGIALFYGSFMAILLFFVIRSASYDHSLVRKDYYEQDLNYEQQYQKIVNAHQLEQAIKLDYQTTKEVVEITFPKTNQQTKGTLTFFKPADHTQDFHQLLDLDKAHQMQISTQGLSRGRWKIQLEWQDEKQEYYQEFEMFL